ncbi:TonB-dependent receptor [Chitinophagaceae bacterium LB-8]|uniref:TonB-dependent receptor n=1 Tax=Paraflavisolibacter caeni TaxID=2982496 RepID=A0A9X3BKB4_9BACT|nr:TonB-dependent receptor [Paraflavisolibacter caeni]MCU7552623.1 TonB-dependent receptor [Paraflavisolibacter caeni]
MKSTNLQNTRLVPVRMKLLLSFVAFFCFMGVSHAQVSGKVIDDKGQPLENVSVTIKGKGIGTQTDNLGAFTITPKLHDVLEFSITGFQSRTETYNGQKSMGIKMTKAVETLSDVVVIGFGQVKRKNALGSISSISAKNLTDRAIVSTSEGMAGQLAGVQVMQRSGLPGEDGISIKVRGTTSISAGVTPLYVVDGIQMDDIKGLNPNDIATLDVLKDAASSAIYGARGSNGVVIITLKKGASTGKPKMEVRSYTGFQKLDKKEPVMTRDEYLTYQIFRRNTEWLNANPANTVDPSQYASRTGTSVLYPEWIAWMKGVDTLPNNDWQDLAYRNAPMRSADISLSGGGELGNFVVSGGLVKQDGIVKGTDYFRTNFRASATFNAAKWMKAGLDIMPNISTRNDPGTTGKDAILMTIVNTPPILPVKSNTQEFGYNYPYFAGTNTLALLEARYRRYKEVNLISNAFVEINPMLGLSVRSQLSYAYRNGQSDNYTGINVSGLNGQASGSSSQSNAARLDWQNTITYNKTFAKIHQINAVVGQSIYDWAGYSVSASGGTYAIDKLGLGNVGLASSSISGSSGVSDQIRKASFFGRLQYSLMDRYLFSASVRQDGSSKFGTNYRYGTFPAISAGWKVNEENFMKGINWLSQLKLRASWGMSGNDAIGSFDYLAKLGVGKYILNNTLVNTWGPANYGNSDLRWESVTDQNIGLDFGAFNDRITLNADVYRRVTNDMLYGVPVPRMTGFGSMTSNVGSIENKGIELQLTTVNVATKDLRWTSSFNFSINRNKVLKLADGVDYRTDIEFGATTFITKVGQPMGSFFMFHKTGMLTEADKKADGTWNVPVATGQMVGNLRYQDVNGSAWMDGKPDGKIDGNDLTFAGTNNPDFLYGFNTNLSYKSFDLSAAFQGQYGGKTFFMGSRHMDAGGGNGINQFNRWLGAWKPVYKDDLHNPIPIINGKRAEMPWDGETPYPAGVNFPGGGWSDAWLYDASFLRIKNLVLGYNFYSPLLKKVGITKLRAYAQGENLYTFTKYPGATPEGNNWEGGGVAGNLTTMPGVDYGNYPLSRRYTLGLDITF